MKKYRIKEVEYANKPTEYYIQEKHWLFGWIYTRLEPTGIGEPSEKAVFNELYEAKDWIRYWTKDSSVKNIRYIND